MPPLNLRLECAGEDYAALAPPLRAALEAAAAEYLSAHPGHAPLTVTSARRSLRRQAELMAAMSPAELEGMYCRHGRPSYIDELLAAMPLDAENAYQILLHRREGYVSRHLQGLAVDVAAESVADAAAFRAALESRGCRVLDERELGRGCLHVAIPPPPHAE